MRVNVGSLVYLGIAVFGTYSSAQVIAFGQELQNNDQANHWVTWIDGENACKYHQALDVLIKTPCDQAFNFGEVEYTFAGCSGTDGPPTILLDSAGLQIGGCVHTYDYVNCNNGDHDIIKHGKCTVVNGE
ncbi:hypothetical protein F5Y01DRAFT_295602 [Xylaria sp. FL0043]|nr:hypothetical protein F5Y01DRAFT_295602 [Xylaria sp. FL0043]